MEWTKQKLAEVCVELQKRAMVDEAFRKELLADPAKAIEMLTGEKPPEDFRLKVVENDPAYTATMVLPDFAGKELTEEESDAVSGGIYPKPYAPGTRHTGYFSCMTGSSTVSLDQGLPKPKNPQLNRPVSETK